MGPNIVCFPGLFGSELQAHFNVITKSDPIVWGPERKDIIFQCINGMQELVMKATTATDWGASGYNVTSTQMLKPYYGEFQEVMKLLNNIEANLVFGHFDWRLSPLELAPALARFLPGPSYLVCHSYSCVCVQALYAYLKGLGKQDQILGVFYLGGPNSMSNYAAVQSLGILNIEDWLDFRISAMLKELTGLYNRMSEFHSISCLLPDEIRDRNNFFKRGQGNRWVTDAWLTKGRVEKDSVRNNFKAFTPPEKMCMIIGSDVPTSFLPESQFANAWAPEVYTTRSGDGTVSLQEAPIWPANNIVQIPGLGHHDMLVSKPVIDFIYRMIEAGFGTVNGNVMPVARYNSNYMHNWELHDEILVFGYNQEQLIKPEQLQLENEPLKDGRRLFMKPPHGAVFNQIKAPSAHAEITQCGG